MGQHLVLVADGARAKILEKDGLKLHQVGEEMIRRDVLGVVDKGAAKPGRVSANGHSHFYAPHTEIAEIREENFLREVARQLNHGFPNLETLVIVAPPNALGELRKLLNEHILGKVEHEVAKDLTKARSDELAEYVRKPYL